MSKTQLIYGVKVDLLLDLDDLKKQKRFALAMPPSDERDNTVKILDEIQAQLLEQHPDLNEGDVFDEQDELDREDAF